MNITRYLRILIEYFSQKLTSFEIPIFIRNDLDTDALDDVGKMWILDNAIENLVRPIPVRRRCLECSVINKWRRGARHNKIYLDE